MKKLSLQIIVIAVLAFAGLAHALVEDFESASLGRFVDQTTLWEPAGVETPIVTDAVAFSGSQSICNLPDPTTLYSHHVSNHRVMHLALRSSENALAFFMIFLIEASYSTPAADLECARPVKFPEGNPISQGELVQFNDSTGYQQIHLSVFPPHSGSLC